MTTVEELRTALRESRAESRTCVIVAEVDSHADIPDSGVWWDIPIAETSGAPVTRKLRAADGNRKRQRFHY